MIPTIIFLVLLLLSSILYFFKKGIAEAFVALFIVLSLFSAMSWSLSVSSVRDVKLESEIMQETLDYSRNNGFSALERSAILKDVVNINYRIRNQKRKANSWLGSLYYNVDKVNQLKEVK